MKRTNNEVLIKRVSNLLYLLVLVMFFMTAFSQKTVCAAECGNTICESGEHIGNCRQDCFVSGFTGGNFGGNLLWYGVQPWRTTPETLSAFQDIFANVGMEIARFDIYWGKLEPQRGVYDWTITDELLSTVDQNTPVLFILRPPHVVESRLS